MSQDSHPIEPSYCGEVLERLLKEEQKISDHIADIALIAGQERDSDVAEMVAYWLNFSRASRTAVSKHFEREDPSYLDCRIEGYY